MLDDEAQDMNRDVYRLFDQYSVTAQLNTIAEPEDDIYQDYQKSVREFKDREYTNAVRDIGTAAEELIKRLCHDLYPEEDIPDGTGGRINQLDKTESGLPAFIGKTVSPLWWLRNKASHTADYEITKGDAHYCLLCFQIATERYVEDHLGADIVY